MSSLSVGVSLDTKKAIIEDMYWLQPIKDTKHINVAELDALPKRNQPHTQVASKGATCEHKPLCVYHWVTNALTGKAHEAATEHIDLTDKGVQPFCST